MNIIGKMKLLFVGERRSKLAQRMGYTWKDGRLAGKQLFDALRLAGINPSQCKFTNIFERGGATTVHQFEGIIVGMGRKVQRKLTKMNIQHKSIVHPAARGKIRRKEVYALHIKLAFNSISKALI